MRDGDRQVNVAHCGAVRFGQTGWTTDSAMVRAKAMQVRVLPISPTDLKGE